MSKPYFLLIKEIAELSNEYHYWKLHLLGNLSINTDTHELLIDAWFVPLTNPELYKNPQTQHRLINNHYYDFSITASHRVQIGIGQLPILRLGTIFWDGFSIDRPKYITRKFQVAPTEENQKIISIGDSWGKWKERNRYYIPASQFQTFQNLPTNESQSNRSQMFKKFSGNKNQSSFPLKPYSAKFLVVDFPKNESPEVSLDDYPLNQIRWFSERGIKSKDGKKPKEGTAKMRRAERLPA